MREKLQRFVSLFSNGVIEAMKIIAVGGCTYV